jgi:drug/metabolite transporter (DMT)-like permease
MKTIQNATLLDYFWLMLLSAIWGSAFVGIGYALSAFPPMVVAFYRILIAAVAIGLFVWVKRLPLPRDRRSWTLLGVLGLVNNALPFYLISWGQQYVSASTAAVILAIGPFVALLMAHWLTHDEKITPFKLVGVALGFAGVFILFGEDFFTGELNSLYGKLAILIATIGYVSSGLMIRRLSHIDTLVCAGAMFATAVLWMLPFVWMVPFGQSAILSAPFLTILYLALIPTALASVIRIQLVQRTGVQFMSQVSYLIPLFAIFWAWVFLGEVPELIVWAALALILSGLFIRKLKV